MEKQKGVRRVNIFSSEGRDTLCQIVQVREDKLNDLLEQPELEKKIGDETARIGSGTHCLSCNATFTTREEQVR